MTGERFTWQLKTDMNTVMRREAPGGASGAGPMESTVPSAAETMVSSPPSGVLLGVPEEGDEKQREQEEETGHDRPVGPGRRSGEQEGGKDEDPTFLGDGDSQWATPSR